MTSITQVRAHPVPQKKSPLTFIDLFAGIGGFHLALHNLGATCVFASEIDEKARLTYQTNWEKLEPKLFESLNFAGDISAVDKVSIPDHDLLCGGFPCQPFSQAGYKRGFHEELDNRGNMFFEIVKTIKAKKPRAYFLENVRHLKNHDEGRTFETIRKTIEGLGYSFKAQVVKASDHGLPQHRPRLFMVGFRNEKTEECTFDFPMKEELEMSMSDVFGEPCNKKIGYTLRVGGRSSGIMDRRNWDGYMVNGREIRLTPEHGKKMMGLPADFEFPVTNTQAMKQLGNSVAVPAIQATAQKILEYLKAGESTAKCK